MVVGMMTVEVDVMKFWNSGVVWNVASCDAAQPPLPPSLSSAAKIQQENYLASNTSESSKTSETSNTSNTKKL